MSGRVRLKEFGILDEELPTLLETVFKFLSENIERYCQESSFTQHLTLKDGIVIPNEICDR